MERSSASQVHFSRLVAAVSALLLWSSLLHAREKTDVVILRNGDRVTCEIKRLDRGKLEVSTDAMGTIGIKWDRIDQLTSHFFFEVELQSGRKFLGSIDNLPEEKKMVVAGLLSKAAVEYPQVVRIAPIEESFLKRLKGSVDVGFSFTQAQTATQWSANAAAKYRVPKYEASAELSSLLKEQDEAQRVLRNTINFNLQRFFGKRWLGLGLTRFQQNESQDLDLRAVLGGGLGRRIVQTNRMNLAFVGGAAVARERFTGEEFTTSAEGIAGISFETFQFDHPEMDITTLFLAFPSLTTLGRVRLELDGKVRFEIVKDLYWSLSVFDSFDSDPPGGARKNDFGVTTSFGWTF